MEYRLKPGDILAFSGWLWGRLALIMESLAATGIRVGELRYINVEAARQGRATIALKGKTCMILLPRKLCRRLLHFARKTKIASGEIFLTGGGKSISRRQVWHELKKRGIKMPHFCAAFFALHLSSTQLEQVKGVEPSYRPWEGRVLPMNYTCIKLYLLIIAKPGPKCKHFFSGSFDFFLYPQLQK